MVELAGYHVTDPGRRQPLSGEPANRDDRRFDDPLDQLWVLHSRGGS